MFLTLRVVGFVVMIQSFKVTGSLSEAVSGCEVFCGLFLMIQSFKVTGSLSEAVSGRKVRK
jgi:hypothetical protein